MRGQTIMQTPHGLVLGSFPINGRWVKEAGWHNFLPEDIVDQLLAALLGDGAFLPPVDILLELPIPLHVAANPLRKFRMQIKISGVLALEGDEVSREGHVVTDEYPVPNGEL